MKEGRAHSFILAGPSGVGKTTLARIIANVAAGGQATATNIDEVPAADHTGVDDMRAVATRSLSRAIGVSPVKTIIIDEAHRLSAQAWDVLLKPIEEPPKHVFWCLCTTELGKIPKTIQTRCVRFDLKLLSEDQLLELLIRVADQEGFTTPDEVLETIAENSGGSPRQCLVHLEQCAYCTSADQARSFMRTVGQSKEVVDIARLLVAKKAASWQTAIKLLNTIGDVNPESVRIILCNYIAGALLKSKTENEARNLLRVLDCFSSPYAQSDKMAPLLLSIGLALGLDQ